jgi:hypothetical protein
MSRRWLGSVIALAVLVISSTGCGLAPITPRVVGTPSATTVHAPSPVDVTVFEVSDEASFEILRLGGRPTVLAVLDPTNTWACNTIYAVVNGAATEYFGRVGFASVDLDQPAGAALAERYGPGPSTAGIIYFDRLGQVSEYVRGATPGELRQVLDQLLAE